MKNIDLKSVITGVALILISGCSTEPEDVYGCTDPDALNYNPESTVDDGSCEYSIVECDDTITDLDGNVYEAVLIGNHCWMAENLKVTHYRNGDEIPTGHSDSEWSNLSTGAYAIYPWDNDDASQNTCGGDCADVYGNLYNGYTVEDDRGICPEGWHVPTNEEWMDLEMALGMSFEEAHGFEDRGTNEGSKMGGNADLWNSGDLEDNGEFGTSGFIALPGGCRSSINGYGYIGDLGYYWSSTEYGSNYAGIRYLFYNNSRVYRVTGSKHFGFPVRCTGD
ncbi:MAG: fibrobacter succinogenes major paralogous domain-containing protein [Candidatus Marinimicrobia bacterium]|nr:fibrobacter succinogenes major paralogous domain-containing protein [Candidatus Neomarinimicrobiota bacterium]